VLVSKPTIGHDCHPPQCPPFLITNFHKNNSNILLSHSRPSRWSSLSHSHSSWTAGCWRWRQYDYSRRRLLFTNRHGVTYLIPLRHSLLSIFGWLPTYRYGSAAGCVCGAFSYWNTSDFPLGDLFSFKTAGLLVYLFAIPFVKLLYIIFIFIYLRCFVWFFSPFRASVFIHLHSLFLSS